MGLLAAWVLFPAVALAVAGGHGLLLRRLAGGVVPGVLVLPLGVATLVVAAQLTTYFGGTAPLTVPLVVLLAVVGWAVGWRELFGARSALPAIGVFAVTFLCFGGPVILSGQATLSGYAVLGDTAVHLIGADALLDHGRDFSSLPGSTYEATLDSYYGHTGYPSGGPAAVGALTRLVGGDVAWTFNAFLALLGGALGLTMLWLLRRLGAGRVAAPVGAVAAAQPALLYAYAQMGSIKEVGAGLMIPLTLACVLVWLRERDRGARTVVPVAVAVAAAVAVIGAVVAVWVVPILLAAVIAVALGPPAGRRLAARHGALLVGAVVVLAFQSVLGLKGYLGSTSSVLTAQTEGGNLLQPLSTFQAVGVWLAGDFRLRPDPALAALSAGLIGLVLFAAAAGLADALRRRVWIAVFYVLASVAAMVYLTSRGSPWADGKALMLTSPTIVLAAVLGAAGIARVRRFEGSALLTAIVVGVLYSNALAYHDASLAPRARFDELRTVAARIGDKGPTLLPDWDENAKHFLRRAAPENPNEPYAPRRPLLNERTTDLLGPQGKELAYINPGLSSDVDPYGEVYMREFRTIVMRDRPTTSRPPSMFRRTFHGRWYDVWQRDDGAARRLVAHLPVGTVGEPSARPACHLVRRLARLAGPGGSLVYAPRPPVVKFAVQPGPTSPIWPPAPQDPTLVQPMGRGALARVIDVPRSGRYELWIEGSFGRPIDIALDGRLVGRVGQELNFRGPEERVAMVTVTKGRHALRLSTGGGDLQPGNGGDSPNRLIGPLYLAAADPMGVPLRTIDRSHWRELCGQTVDWIDAWRGVNER